MTFNVILGLPRIRADLRVKRITPIPDTASYQHQCELLAACEAAIDLGINRRRRKWRDKFKPRFPQYVPIAISEEPNDLLPVFSRIIEAGYSAKTVHKWWQPGVAYIKINHPDNTSTIYWG